MRSILRFFDRNRGDTLVAERPVPDSTGVTLGAAAAAESVPTSGLIVVETTLQAAEARQATLRVFLGEAAKPAFEKTVQLTAEPQQGWLAVHGHLLGNGPARLRLELSDAGGPLAERTLTVKARNEGPLAEATRDSLKRTGVPAVIDLCDAGLYDYDDPGLKAWYDRAPAEIEAHLAHLKASGAANDAEIAALRQFTEEGYLVLPDVIDQPLLGRLNAALDDAVEKKIEGYEWGVSQRLHNLHNQYPAIRELWLHPTVLRMLTLIFEAPARPCQSLTYVFGSEQQYHQDTIHLTPFPAGRMCGVWSALEDVQPDSGELVVFPKSHRLPRVYMKDADLAKVTGDWTEFGEKVVAVWTSLLESGKFTREIYRPKAGTVLIWHENLMHAGSMRLDREKSRRSIVGHYFAEGAVVYYDSSGMPGVLYEGELTA
ncbi:phytanoyl-CoA dioxygenase family protein [Phenylobacterium sp.]|uniref:phytanoyl-CoA dioxygenase family protein n=1 Tax=Phenylobacterium sp. TaxID=1871053 RepID=UPI002DE6E867|nr:phytanoyl-CoA dioxygenase family protein [Phenylobacterium sp.]